MALCAPVKKRIVLLPETLHDMEINSLTDAMRDRLSILVDVPPTSITDDTTFEALDVDSLMVLELVAMLEQRLGYELAEEDLRSLRTLADVRHFVEKANSEGAAPPAAETGV